MACTLDLFTLDSEGSSDSIVPLPRGFHEAYASKVGVRADLPGRQDRVQETEYCCRVVHGCQCALSSLSKVGEFPEQD